jgi:RNA polymerase sigma-70 factor (ECF subfamily)
VPNDICSEILKLLPRLRRFACALTADSDRSDDLVQEGCARALARLDQWRPGTRLDSWMYKIIRNVWLDQIRASRARGPLLSLDADIELAGEDGRAVIENKLTLNHVLEALAQLPEEQRAPIVFVCLEGLSYDEAAALLEIPVGTVASRLARGRRALYALAIEGASPAEKDPAEKEHDKAD